MPESPSPPSLLPSYSEAMYKRPNPDSTRQACSNCIMFVKGEDKCIVHPRDLTVRAHYWCTYHIFGAPIEKWMDHPGGMQPVDPSFSGLRLAGGGIACDNCIYFVPGPQESLCTALVKEIGGTELAPVAPLAICARHRIS